MQPNNQNAQPQDYLNCGLSEIGTFTQCRLCDIHFYFNFDKQVHISTFDILGDDFASKTNEGMMCFQFILLLILLFLIDVFIFIFFVYLYIDQCQNQTHPTNIQGIPNKVTCNPPDDTACNDDLLSSFTSYCHTSIHGSQCFDNQKSNLQNRFTYSTSGDKHFTNHYHPSHPIQNRFNYCPMLHPLQNDCNRFESSKIDAPMDHYNCHMYPPSHFINLSINHSSHH